VENTKAVTGGVVLMVNVADVPGPTELGLIEHCGASAGVGETEQARDTATLNPLTALMLTVEVEDCPAFMGLGLGEEPTTENSGTAEKVATTA